MLLPIHVAAGGLALILGAVALLAKKGGTIHRRSGLLFVCAMLLMGGTAAILGNVSGGLMAVYFVVTALTTVRPVSPWTRGVNFAAMLFAVAFALLTVVAGVEAFNSPEGSRNGVPFPMLFFLATVVLLAAAGDVRIMRFGAPRGRPRLARHLWRMCFARRENPSRPIHDGADARAADSAAVWNDVLLVVEGPRLRSQGSPRDVVGPA